MPILSKPGEFNARAREFSVYETRNGALCLALLCAVTDGECQGDTTKHTMTIVKQDGTVQTRTVDTLKEVFGWDGIDPFWFMDNAAALAEKAFTITVEMEQGVKDGVLQFDEQGQPIYYAKVKWLNAPGGGPGLKMPDPADRRAIATKYGSKFRALAGGTPAKPPTAPTPPKPPGPPTPPPPPKKAPVATLEEAWAALWDNNPGMAEDDAKKLWEMEIARNCPNKTAATMTPEDWGKVKDAFKDRIPM